MNNSFRKKLGQLGEQIAASYLITQGYTIMHTNFRTSYGEIDLIARSADLLVFVEVKTRSKSTLGPPEISITRRKFSHMVASAEAFLLDHPELNLDWRIDVISILHHATGQNPEITHFENINHVF